jgi:outer membrane protein assembly factor BamB
MGVVFSVQAKLFAVFRDADGSVTWSDYDGNKVMAAFPLEGGSRCVVLLHPDASEKARFENLFCVDHDGKIVWTAELPETHDRDMDARMESGGLHAGTWSSHNMTLDPADGRVIRSNLVK